MQYWSITSSEFSKKIWTNNGMKTSLHRRDFMSFISFNQVSYWGIWFRLEKWHVNWKCISGSTINLSLSSSVCKKSWCCPLWLLHRSFNWRKFNAYMALFLFSISESEFTEKTFSNLRAKYISTTGFFKEGSILMPHFRSINVNNVIIFEWQII